LGADRDSVAGIGIVILDAVAFGENAGFETTIGRVVEAARLRCWERRSDGRNRGDEILLRRKCADVGVLDGSCRCDDLVYHGLAIDKMRVNRRVDPRLAVGDPMSFAAEAPYVGTVVE